MKNFLKEISNYKMQIYLKPYPHNTYCNVPYSSEKVRSDGSRNYGFVNVKKYKGLLKKIPEITNLPKLGELIEKVNAGEAIATYGCDHGVDPIGNYHQAWAFVNLYFDNFDLNHSEEYYLKLVSKFLEQYAADHHENLIIEFISSPTNFHDFEKIKKGATPKEETIEFRGYSMNCKIIGVGATFDDAKTLLNTGLETVGEFLFIYK